MPKVALKAVEMLRAEPIRRVEPRLGGVMKERVQVMKRRRGSNVIKAKRV